MRRIALTVACFITCALAACSTPTPSTTADNAPVAGPDSASAPATPAAAPVTPAPDRAAVSPAPGMSAPMPAEPVRRPTLSRDRIDTPRPALVNRSCRTSADCVVKDVGSCCGTYPACVNTDSPTDPRAVQLECARSGMASTCEVPVIDSCECNNGQCAASTGVTR